MSAREREALAEDEKEIDMTIPTRELTSMLESLQPFIPADRPWGAYADAAIALGLDVDYAQTLANAHVHLVLPLLRNTDGVYRIHVEDTAEVLARETVAAFDAGLPGNEVWPQDKRWNAALVAAAYARCEFRNLHARGLCGCVDAEVTA